MNTWQDISSYYHVYYVGYSAHPLLLLHVYNLYQNKNYVYTWCWGDYRVWQQIMQTHTQQLNLYHLMRSNTIYYIIFNSTS